MGYDFDPDDMMHLDVGFERLNKKGRKKKKKILFSGGF